MQYRRGYSLFELLFTIALISVLAAGSVPYLRASIASSRVASEINAMIRAVHVARSEAVKRNGETVVCPTLDGNTCQSSVLAWQSGWLVFANNDRDSPPVVDKNETILMRHQVADQIRVEANRKAFVFHNYARRSSNGTLIFCTTDERVKPRAVVISYTGRPRTATERSDGKPYQCKD